MKSFFVSITACLIVVFTAIEGKLACDPHTGPAGSTKCFLETPYYSNYQCGTCLTDAYIRQRSRGQHRCRNTRATYCYYPCMLEKYGLDRGPVYNDCLCNASVPLPQPPVILSPGCYSPDGINCSWYRQCLHRMFPCTGQPEYAISYGEKFCNLYTNTKLHFSRKGLRWIDAARKCLQVALVPVLYLCQEHPTCKEIRTKAFKSHVPCYVEPYKGFSVCTIPPTDWLRIFWTIKSSFVSDFVETFKASVETAAKCAGIYAEELKKYLFSINVWLWDTLLQKHATISDTGLLSVSDDELAYAVMVHISSSLRWDQLSTVDWYVFAANSTFVTTEFNSQPGKQLTIQVIDF